MVVHCVSDSSQKNYSAFLSMATAFKRAALPTSTTVVSVLAYTFFCFLCDGKHPNFVTRVVLKRTTAMEQTSNKRQQNQTVMSDLNDSLFEVLFDLLCIFDVISKHWQYFRRQCSTITTSGIWEPLTILFNLCLNEGIFPNIWKIAHVTPLHKKGSENYVTVIVLFRC